VNSAALGEPATQPLSIGVSIVLYRMRVREIAPLLEQLLAQGARRIYIVDNSPPEFGTFADWSASERVIAIPAGTNLGYGRGHNIAIGQSVLEHDYHLICNPDITLGPGTLPALADLLARRRQVGLCMPRVIGPDGQMHYLCKRSPVLLDFVATAFVNTAWGARRRADFELRGRDYSSEMQVECLSGCFMFFRSVVLRQLRGFDDQYFLYFEDFDLSRRVSRFAETLYYPGVYVVHQHARAHARSLRLRLIFMRSALRYFNKWGWFSAHPSAH
jgi:GT2 family glycosyltransferase